MGLVVSLLVGTSFGKYAAREKDKTFHQNRVAAGGCLKEFQKATSQCHPVEVGGRRDPKNRVVDVEACIKTTAALRQCFAANPKMFKHMYLPRMDYGLDEDLKPSPEEVKEERTFSYRWWTGMRRS